MLSTLILIFCSCLNTGFTEFRAGPDNGQAAARWLGQEWAGLVRRAGQHGVGAGPGRGVDSLDTVRARLADQFGRLLTRRVVVSRKLKFNGKINFFELEKKMTDDT